MKTKKEIINGKEVLTVVDGIFKNFIVIDRKWNKNDIKRIINNPTANM